MLDFDKKKLKMKIIKDNEVLDITPELIAEIFWNFDSKEQAEFFNELNKIADFKFAFQLQYITDEDGLTYGGRRVMQAIGEYSHFGLGYKK